MSKRNLPAWLDACLPDVAPANVLDVDGDEYVLLSADGATSLGTDIEAAYDEANKRGDLKFSDAIKERFGDGFLGLSVPSKYGVRLLMDYSDTDRQRVLEGEWARFQRLDEQWRANPDFANSFYWLDSHPAFWVRRLGNLDPSSASWRDKMFWDWQCGDFINSKATMGVSGQGGKTYIWLEAGAHIAEEQHYDRETETEYVITDAYRSHYHDLRLDVWAPTYEAAIIALAHKVDKFFYPDGTERENVEYEKSELETTLEERVAEMEATTGYESAPQPQYRRVRFADLGQITIDERKATS